MTGAWRRASRTRPHSTTSTPTSGATSVASRAYDTLAGRWQGGTSRTADTPSTCRSRPCGVAGCPSSRSSTARRWRSRRRQAAKARTSDARGGAIRGRPAASTGKLGFAVEDPDAPENWPRVWFIWRGNAIGTQRQGPRVLPASLPGHAQQRHRAGDGRRTSPARSSIVPRRRPASSTWWWTSTSAWTPRRCTPTSCCRPRPGTRRTT